MLEKLYIIVRIYCNIAKSLGGSYALYMKLLIRLRLIFKKFILKRLCHLNLIYLLDG